MQDVADWSDEQVQSEITVVLSVLENTIQQILNQSKLASVIFEASPNLYKEPELNRHISNVRKATLVDLSNVAASLVLIRQIDNERITNLLATTVGVELQSCRSKKTSKVK